MNLELIPVLLGVFVGLCGLALVADGWMADPVRAGAERRRHVRAERHHGGEIIVGVGLLCAAAALVAHDRWRYSTAAVVVAAMLVLAGAALNARYLGEQFANRGALRRGRAAERRRVGTAPALDDSARRPHDRRLAERRDADASDAAPHAGPHVAVPPDRGAGRAR